MSSVKIATKLPKSSDRNGLDAVETELLADPGRVRLGIVVLKPTKITRDLEAYDTVPTVAIEAIEVVSDGADVGKLRTMLQRLYEQRTGNVELPLPWEQVLAELVAPSLPGTEPGS